MKNKHMGKMLAVTVGMLFATSTFATTSAGVAVDASATIKCTGANACKGQSACRTATNTCRGLNACKGQGFIMVASEEKCTAAGGIIDKSVIK